LIGANGAGKTTLLNVVSGMLSPDAGSVRVFGREVAGLPAEYRIGFGMARSFQDARLFPGLTVRETMRVALAASYKVGAWSGALSAPWARRTERQAQEQLESVISILGLGDYADTFVADLSTGTRRVCDLAAQLAARPRLLLLDEPTAGLAQRESEAFGPLLRRIRQELGCAILIVEHDMPLLMGLCDRVYAMEAGSVLACGTAAEIQGDSRVIASYLGRDRAAINRSGPAAKPATKPATKAAPKPARVSPSSHGRRQRQSTDR
jgi:ABC-type branched-subunit amino acid transport system ATPase component